MCCLIYKFLLILTQKMQISFLKILPENALKFVSKKMRICVKNFAQLQYIIKKKSTYTDSRKIRGLSCVVSVEKIIIRILLVEGEGMDMDNIFSC